MKGYRLLILVFFLSMLQEIFTGFVAGTLVKVPDGYEAIEKLVPGDIVCSINEQGNAHISKVLNIFSYKSSCAIIFELENEIIIAAPFQKYYILESNSWQDAAKVSIDTKLCSLCKQQIAIQDIKQLQSEIEFFDICLEDVHTFCVTKQDVVVHNFPSFVIGLSFAFGGGITFEGIKAGLCIAGLWVGTKIFKRSNQKDKAEFDVQVTALCGPGADQFYIDDYIYLYKSVEDILKDTIPGQKTKGRAKQYVKPGGYEDAIKDFENLGPASVKSLPGKEGKTGILSDGCKVNVRIDSKDKRPTLEIQNPDNTGKVIKIRYDDSLAKE